MRHVNSVGDRIEKYNIHIDDFERGTVRAIYEQHALVEIDAPQTGHKFVAASLGSLIYLSPTRERKLAKVK